VTSDPVSAPPDGPGVEAGVDRVRAMLTRDTASAWLGIEAVEIGVGRARMRMRVRRDMVQGYGSCHGGLVFALADTAFAAACNGRGSGPTVAASAEITWVAAAFADDVLVADAVEHTRYGRNGVTDVRVTREADGALLALFRGRSLELSRPPSPVTGGRGET
jgi:acyl-CoA thioesterase